MSTEDIVMYTFCGILGAMLVAAVGYLLVTMLIGLYRLIFLQFSFGLVRTSKGKVMDMQYTPPRTNVAGRGVVTRTPEKNEVLIKTDLKETTLDSDKLYQRVRVGEKVSVHYQERFKRPRFWNGEWTHDGYRLLAVTSALDQEVVFNDKKPVRRGYEK